MGMFDSIYDRAGAEWQTKAYACLLDRYRIGDSIGIIASDYQLAVLGGRDGGTARDSFATIRDGRLADVPVERDNTLPLMDYHGFLYELGNEPA